ncbi:MAG: TRAP transporter substrate-binding protein DctP [Nitrospirae bacterium]|nr:TRAP transporter substrate-binding protein DctP [Nitrospirota bacterium]
MSCRLADLHRSVLSPRPSVLCLLFAAATLLLPLSAYGQAQKSWEFSLGTIAPGNSPYMKILKEATDHVEALSKGQVRFKLHASGVLGDEPAMVEMVRKGDLSAGVFTLSGIGEISPEFTVLLLPYLFRNEREIEYVRNKMNDTIAEAFSRVGFRLIVWADIGSGLLFTRVPVPTFEEFKKRKIWVWPGERILPAFAEYLGIQTVPLPLAQVQEALRADRLEVVFANALGAVVLGWYRDVGYVTRLGGVFAQAVLVTGRKQWDQAPEGVRKLILAEVEVALPKLFEIMRRDEETALKGISKRGVQVLQLDGPAEEEFRRVSEDFQRKFVDGKPNLQKVLEEVQRHLREFRSSSARRRDSLDSTSYAR